MKTNYFNLLKSFIVLTMFTGINSYSQKKDDDKSKGKKEKTYYDVINDKAVSDTGLFDVHKVDEKYFYEINDSLLGRDMLDGYKNCKNGY